MQVPITTEVFRKSAEEMCVVWKEHFSKVLNGKEAVLLENATRWHF